MSGAVLALPRMFGLSGRLTADRNDDLVESLDFRFASSLKEITVPQPDPFPPTTGHSAVTIEFHHTTDCVVNAESYSSVLSVKRGSLLSVVRGSDSAVPAIYVRTCVSSWELGNVVNAHLADSLVSSWISDASSPALPASLCGSRLRCRIR
jgi:hypothetical protein